MGCMGPLFGVIIVTGNIADFSVIKTFIYNVCVDFSRHRTLGIHEDQHE